MITQNSTGVPGTAEELDQFGSSLAAGDLDGDGYADLVVGTPSESIGDREHVGAATVVWGSKSGLSGGSSLPSPSGLTEYGGYSSGIATGDFNGDGKTDVTITGQSRTGLYRGPFARTGLFGSAGGLKGTGATSYTQNTAGVPGSSETGDAFGTSVRLVDLDRNGKVDLVVGTGYENGYGAVTVLKGTASGLTTTGAKSFTARDATLKGGADFGRVIAQ